MAPEFPSTPPDEEIVKGQARLKRKTWRRLAQIGAEQRPKRSMNAVLEFFLEWAIQDYDAGQARKGKK